MPDLRRWFLHGFNRNGCDDVYGMSRGFVFNGIKCCDVPNVCCGIGNEHRE